jgi:hypothetical protein
MHSRPIYYSFLPLLLAVVLLSAILASTKLQAQTPATAIPVDTSIKPLPLVIKPTVGFGVGMLSFLGDHNGSHVGDPQYGRLGAQLSFAQKLSPAFTFSLSFLYGSLAANQHLGRTYLNFESKLRSGSMEIEYNFDHFFKEKKRRMSPYLSLGLESFEFLSKTDMYDASGNKYYYWTDGTVRNIDEHSLYSSHAVVLKPDYTYETDLRTLNKADYGKYPEFALGIPIGAGAIFHLSPRLDFKVGTTLHFTFTDYIDGLPAADIGPGKHYDKYLFSSFMLRYDLNEPDNEASRNKHLYDAVDFMALDVLDEDNDGVPDSRDSCLGTPAGVPVDPKGCPLDTDGDGVPDYLDKEASTPSHSIVDVNGVAMSDSLIAENWDRFNDSTMKYAIHVTLPPGGGEMFSKQSSAKKNYTVLLGTFHKGLSTEKMTRFLSIEDIRSTGVNDSTTIYTAGHFTDVLEAEKRKEQLFADGLTDSKVVYEKDGQFLDPGTIFSNNGKSTEPISKETKGNVSKDPVVVKENKDSSSKEHPAKVKKGKQTSAELKEGTGINTPGVVFRVQLGAFKHRISPATFGDAGNVLEFKGEDGLYKYLTGSFSNFNDAAKHKVEMLSRGYQGAFIAAYKNGKRVSLTEVGAIPAGKASVNEADNDKTPAVKKDLVVFKVQIGVFKNEPPDDLKAKFSTVKNIQQSATSSGLTRYTAGSFSNYTEAQKLKEELHKQGIEGAFVIAFFKNELISVPEALELLKQ